MRWGIAFLALAALTACIPRADPRRAPPRPALPPAADRGSPDTLQCHIDLARERIRFRALPDQRFAGGCSALGAVQLVDMGVPATGLRAMTCPVARQFARWARESVQPAADQWLRARIVRIETFGTYACRTRNSRRGAVLSEHAFANAVDVSGFVLADGRRITVEQGWNGEDERVRRFLRAVHQGGCRRFNITISPDADADHYNHLHFDMGRGPYCR
ncbi:MAG TPA: extensin family protein [Allosphingosinicella sp.]|nr:extensin family protein [Allosphingosinicella sp.]